MSKAIREEFVVADTLHKHRLDVVLATTMPEFSRSKLTQWLKSGHITVNALPAKAGVKVLAGDVVRIEVQLDEEIHDLSKSTPQDIKLDIVYEDEHLLVVNKPAGLVVHPGAGNQEGTLVNALLFHALELKALPRAGIIHRLDKDTTGLLVVAKTLQAHTSLVRQMQDRDIHRHYTTLVHGHIIGGATIETCFGRHPRNRLKMAVHQQGREAITHYSVTTHLLNMTLLKVTLDTGRTHQIRVHMAHIGHPVFGDPLYGGRLKFPKGADAELRALLQQFNRQALHACELSFIHPETEEELTFTADLPDDFKTLIQTLSHYDELYQSELARP